MRFYLEIRKHKEMIEYEQTQDLTVENRFAYHAVNTDGPWPLPYNSIRLRLLVGPVSSISDFTHSSHTIVGLYPLNMSLLLQTISHDNDDDDTYRATTVVSPSNMITQMIGVCRLVLVLVFILFPPEDAQWCAIGGAVHPTNQSYVVPSRPALLCHLVFFIDKFTFVIHHATLTDVLSFGRNRITLIT